MDTEIAPALSSVDGKALSPDEFQRLLYEYFEDKGILADLRAHLRSQMINILRDTSLGKMLVNKNKEMSPKLQAVNLLIAEYLLQKDYHYSLSVFSTEVPLSNIFPTHISEFNSKTEIGTFHFSENDMWDILETLGYFRNTETGQKIADAYRSGVKLSLLNCIVRTVNGYEDSNKLVVATFGTTLEQFVTILRENSVRPELTLVLINHIKSVVEGEIGLIRAEKESELSAYKKQLDEGANKKVDRYKRKMAALEQSYEQQQKRAGLELENAKSNLKTCAESLQSKYKDVRQLEAELKESENKLVEREHEIKEKERMLQKELEEVISEKLSYRELKAKLDISQQMLLNEQAVNSLQQVVSKTPTEERAQQTSDTTNLENVLLKQNIQQLEYHIDSITQQNTNYLSRIQELALKTNNLMKELEDTRRQRDGGTTLAASLVVPSVPNLTIRTRAGIASYNGSGEEGNRVNNLIARQFRNCSHREVRHKNHKHLPSTSSSDENSPTDTVLKESKQRLKELELETNTMDKQYNTISQVNVSRSASNTYQDFHVNVETIRDNLINLFQKEHTSTTSTQLLQFVPEVTITDVENPEVEISKIQSLIVETPDIEDANYQAIVNDLAEGHNQMSAQSSIVVLTSSFSTVDVSPDKTETDEDETEKESEKGHLELAQSQTVVGMWDGVGLSCLVAFVIELFLFR